MTKALLSLGTKARAGTPPGKLSGGQQESRERPRRPGDPILGLLRRLREPGAVLVVEPGACPGRDPEAGAAVIVRVAGRRTGAGTLGLAARLLRQGLIERRTAGPGPARARSRARSGARSGGRPFSPSPPPGGRSWRVFWASRARSWRRADRAPERACCGLEHGERDSRMPRRRRKPHAPGRQAASPQVRQACVLPTPERWRRGAFRLVDGRYAGQRIAYDDAPTPLRRAFLRDEIERRQLDAGEHFEALFRGAATRSDPRSCLDWSQRGEDDRDEARIARVVREWREATRAVDARTALVLIDPLLLPSGCRQPASQAGEGRAGGARRPLAHGLSPFTGHSGLPMYLSDRGALRPAARPARLSP